MPAKKRMLGSPLDVHRGDDHHVEALGLIEGAPDVGVVDAAVAPARRRNERQQVDVGVAVERDGVGKLAAPDGDVDQAGIARARRRCADNVRRWRSASISNTRCVAAASAASASATVAVSSSSSAATTSTLGLPDAVWLARTSS